MKRRNADDNGLTRAERRVLKLITTGYTNREAADTLFLSVKTIEKHRSNIFLRLRIHNAVDLTHFALARGYIQLKDFPQLAQRTSTS